MNSDATESEGVVDGGAVNGSCLQLVDEAATQRLGRALANTLAGSGVIFLRGQLGAGKTTLVRAILRELGYSGPVKSPTYTLVEEYQLARVRLFHFDLYRLSDPEELEFFGIRDYLASAALFFIEWPEKGQGLLPTADLEINLVTAGSGRTVSLIAHGREMEAVVRAVHQHFANNNDNNR